MAKTTGKTSKSQAKASALWNNPELVVFQGEEQLPEGAVARHGLVDATANLFGRKKEAVHDEWGKVLAQMQFLLDQAVSQSKDFSLDEITFQLGFSAEGHFVFVAKAGVQTTISAKFKRKPT